MDIVDCGRSDQSKEIAGTACSYVDATCPLVKPIETKVDNCYSKLQWWIYGAVVLFDLPERDRYMRPHYQILWSSPEVLLLMTVRMGKRSPPGSGSYKATFKS